MRSFIFFFKSLLLPLASATVDLESPMAAQRQLISEGFFHYFLKKLMRVCLLSHTGDEETTVAGQVWMSQYPVPCGAMIPSKDCFGIFHYLF